MDLQAVGLDLLVIASIFAGFHIMGDWVQEYAFMGVSSQDLHSQKRAKSPSIVLIRPILYKI